MNDQIIVAMIGLAGVIIGGIIGSVLTFIQEYRNHQRWLIEKRIAYIKEQIEGIDRAKKFTLKDLHNLFQEKKFENNDNFVSSVPMEVINAFNKHLPDGKTVMISDLPEEKKREIFNDVATALERKKIELQKNIKKLLA